MIDYMMQDITDNMPAPVSIVPGTLVRKWNSNDYPFNKEQALLVLRHTADTGFYISQSMAETIHACLVSDNGLVYPPLPPIRCSYGSSMHGWAWLDSDGWHGGYETKEEAYDACNKSRVGWAG